jgi:hypothetical protein
VSVCNALYHGSHWLCRSLRLSDPALHFAYLESVVLMVEAVSRMGTRKAALGVPWQPTFFSDQLEKPAV